MLALVVMLAPPLDKPQAWRVPGPNRPHVVTVAALHGTPRGGQSAPHPRDREPRHRFPHDLGDLWAERQQHGRDNHRGVALHWDRLGGTCPPGGHLPEPVGQRPGLRQAPAPSIPLPDLTRRPPWGIEDRAQGARPAPRPADRPQAPWRRTGGRAGRAHREALVARSGARPPPLPRARGALGPQARDQARRRVRHVSTPQPAATSQRTAPPPPQGPGGQAVRGTALVRGGGLGGSARPPRTVAAGRPQPPPRAATHAARARPPDRRLLAPRFQGRAVPQGAPGARRPPRRPAGRRQGRRQGGRPTPTDGGTARPPRACRQDVEPLGEGLGPARQGGQPSHACLGHAWRACGAGRDPPPHEAPEQRHHPGPRAEPGPHTAEPRRRPRRAPLELAWSASGGTAEVRQTLCARCHRWPGDRGAMPTRGMGTGSRVLRCPGGPPLGRGPP